MAQLEVPGPGGRRRRLKRRAKTKAEAVAILRQMRAEVSKHGGLADGQRLVEQTLGDYLVLQASLGKQAKTIEGDEWMVGIIRQGLGRRRVAALSVADCDHFLDLAARGGEFGQPLGRRSLTRIRSTLVNALNNDLRRGLVTRNVAELAVLPPVVKVPKSKRAISHDELVDLIAAAENATAVLIDLSGRNGLRPAEARALRWSRLDLEGMTVTVDAQFNRSHELTRTKTKRANRTIRIDETTADLVKMWRVHQVVLQKRAGESWQDHDLVASTRTGRPVSHRNFHRSLATLCMRVGIDPPISAYELRHTAISLQADEGHPAWQIADWAGTSERMITDVYRHQLHAVAPLGPVGSRS